jgi:hypothetical protein
MELKIENIEVYKDIKTFIVLSFVFGFGFIPGEENITINGHKYSSKTYQILIPFFSITIHKQYVKV